MTAGSKLFRAVCVLSKFLLICNFEWMHYIPNLYSVVEYNNVFYVSIILSKLLYTCRRHLSGIRKRINVHFSTDESCWLDVNYSKSLQIYVNIWWKWQDITPTLMCVNWFIGYGHAYLITFFSGTYYITIKKLYTVTFKKLYTYV